MYDQLCRGYVLNWSEGEPKGCGSSDLPGERDCRPFGTSGMREFPNEVGTDIERGGNCEWKPSAAMGYREGGSVTGGMPLSDEESRKEGTWLEGESAD